MSANPIWIAGYGPVVGAAPVWIAPGDGTVPSAVLSEIVSFFSPVAGATAVWIAGFFAPPPAAIGATPITISGWGGSGGGGGGTTTSVWSASDATANGFTLSNAGLTYTNNANINRSIRGTISHTSGKVYIEFLVVSNSGNDRWGVADIGFNPLTYPGGTPYSAGFGYNGNPCSAGFTSNYNSILFAMPGDVVGIAVDFSIGSIWFAINNVWINSSNPATGVLPMISFVPATVGALFPLSNAENTSEIITLQATAASQKYAPPSGFSAWDGGTAPPPTSVWSSSDATANAMTLSNGGLTVTPSASGYQSIRGTISRTSGKYYAEFLVVGAPTASNGWALGLANAAFGPTSYLGASGSSAGIFGSGNQLTAGFVAAAGGLGSITPSIGDVWSIAVDLTAGNLWIGQNNTWLVGGVPGQVNPNAGTSPFLTIGSPALGQAYFPALTENKPTDSWTLQSTAASQKYAPPSGFVAWDSAAPTHSPQALAYLARTVGGNEGGNGANIATLIDGLVSDGVWAKLDALYVLAQQNQTDAQLNLIGTNYSIITNALAERTITFTPLVGFSFTPNSYLDTGFNPATAPSPKFIQNSANFGFWSNNVVTETNPEMGSSSGNNHIYNSYTALFLARINNGSVGGSATPGAKGLFVGDRPNSTDVVPYWNGVAQPVQTPFASAAPSSFNFIIGFGSGQTIAAAHIGASLGAAGQLALYNRLRTYMTAIGVP